MVTVLLMKEYEVVTGLAESAERTSAATCDMTIDAVDSLINA